jgi:hypothetical protein
MPDYAKEIMSHLIKVTLYFFASALVAIGFGLGASFTAGAFLPGLLVALAVSLAAVLGGVFLTVQARSIFSLVQTGRVVQYGSFWAAGAVALKVAALIFSSVLVVPNAALASLVALAFCFTSATLTGQIPWKGRTWLPVRMKSKK